VFKGTTTLAKLMSSGQGSPSAASLDPAADPSAALVHRWTLSRGPASSRSNYTFYVTDAGVPVKLVMAGKYLMDGSHNDGEQRGPGLAAAPGPGLGVRSEGPGVVCRQLLALCMAHGWQHAGDACHLRRVEDQPWRASPF
jgi:hypothetical protein